MKEGPDTYKSSKHNMEEADAQSLQSVKRSVLYVLHDPVVLGQPPG